MLVQIDEPSSGDVKADAHKNAIGIDLGTTHSIACRWDQERQEARFLTPLVPSVLGFDKTNKRYVGEQALTHPEVVKILSSTKTTIGGHRAVFSDAQEQPINAVEVAAEIIAFLRRESERTLEHAVDAAVITVPAYFNEAQRQATKQAAEAAGLEVLRLVAEPTAAALAYGLDQEKNAEQLEGLYVVFDLGGGTCDLSLLKLHRGVFQVIATQGDNHLGGDDFDHCLLIYLEHKLGFEFYDYQRALRLARNCREALSGALEVTFDYEGHTYQVTRDDLFQASKALLEKITACCGFIQGELAKSSDPLKGVILVGGATRMPMIRELAQQEFKKVPLTDLDADRIVALGAARQAHALTYGSDTLLVDVIPLSLGLELMGGVVETVIERNSAIPCHKMQQFTTYADNQTGLIIHVVQGEREMVADCQSLAKFEIKGIPALPAGVAKVQVSFKVDADGLLTVRAQEESTGVHQEVVVKPTFGLSEQEMQKMVISGLENAEIDFHKRKIADMKSAAGRLINAVTGALAEHHHVISADENHMIMAIFDRLDALLGDPDCDLQALEDAMRELEEKTTHFASARMTDALKKALAGRRVDDVQKELR